MSALIVLSLAACTPDEFDYTAGGNGAPNCDDDSCEQTCPAGFTPNSLGDCVLDGCSPWQTSLADAPSTSMTLAGQHVVIVGNSDESSGRPPAPWAATVAHCMGTDAAVRAFSGDPPMVANAVAFVSDRVHAIGTHTPEGAPTQGAVIKRGLFEEGAGKTLLFDAEPEGGRFQAADVVGNAVWIAGSMGDPSSATGWAVKLLPDDTFCSASFGANVSALALASNGGQAVITGVSDGSVGVWVFDDAACQPPACACAPVANHAVPVSGAASPEPTDIAVLADVAYISGRTGGEQSRGFLVGVDIASGVVRLSREWHSTLPGPSGLLAIDVDGDNVVALGESALNPRYTGLVLWPTQDPDRAEPTLDSGLESVGVPIRVSLLPQSAGVLVLSLDSGIGRLARCDLNGKCNAPRTRR